MAKNIDIRLDILDIFLTRDKVSHKYIEELMESHGYKNSKDALKRTRRDIFEKPVKTGFIENTKQDYLATKKLKDIREIIKQKQKNENFDVTHTIRNLSELSDGSIGFITAYSLNTSVKIDEQKAQRLLESYIEYLEMLLSFEDKSEESLKVA